MQGDASAQAVIGNTHAFGHGLRIDGAVALRWLTLAANQGNRSATELIVQIKMSPDWERRAAALAIATNANLDRSRPEAESRQANRGDFDPIDYGPGFPMQPPSYMGPSYGAGGASGQGTISTPSAPMGARASVEEAYGAGSASRGLLGSQASTRSVGDSSPAILNRAGPGTYSGGNGDIYTQAGPHGVINTRTGEFSPTN